MQHSTLGQIKQVGPAVRFSGSSNRMRSPPPTLGAHTDAVLKKVLELGDADIEGLRRSGIVA